MKMCPFCKATIEDDARFCLYCMTSLDNKEAISVPPIRHRRWLWLVIGAIALFVIVALGWLGIRSLFPISPSDSTPAVATTTTAEAIHTTTTNTSTTAQTPTSATTAEATTSSTTVTTTIPLTPSANVTYTYREAVEGDMYSLHALIPADAIVITSVSGIAEDGVYVIPKAIDGQPVVAIMPHAFSDPSICNAVRSVVFPATISKVHVYAFLGCDSLTDVYFCGSSIYTDTYAFPNTEENPLTIHCKADCHNKLFYYYRNIDQWNPSAMYEEWNGGELQ